MLFRSSPGAVSPVQAGLPEGVNLGRPGMSAPPRMPNMANDLYGPSPTPFRQPEPPAPPPQSQTAVSSKSPPEAYRDIIAAMNGRGATVDKILDQGMPLLTEMRNNGLAVMQPRSGVGPIDPVQYGQWLLEAHKAVDGLKSQNGPRGTYPTHGLYPGEKRLRVFDDGYGDNSGIAVPFGTSAADIARLLIDSQIWKGKK